MQKHTWPIHSRQQQPLMQARKEPGSEQAQNLLTLLQKTAIGAICHRLPIRVPASIALLTVGIAAIVVSVKHEATCTLRSIEAALKSEPLVA